MHTSLPFICGYCIRSDYILRNQSQNGIEINVVTSAQHPNARSSREELDGITYWRTPALRGKYPPIVREYRLMSALHRRVTEVAKQWKPDVVHAHSPVLVGKPASAVARALGLPFVYEVRDLWENASVDRGKFKPNSPMYRLARGYETAVLRSADSVVTICGALRDELAQRVGNPDKVRVVDNGVDTDEFLPDDNREAAKRKLGLVGKEVIGYVGTFQPYEGLSLLIDAMPHILKRIPNAHLLIAGSGGEEPNLRAQAESLYMNASVTFTGRLPHDQVAAIYAASNVLAYPRILTRTTALTTPLKPLEAMSMARTVIVSDVPAMRELVVVGVTGLEFLAGEVSELASACVSILGDPVRQRDIGLNAREWVVRERQWPRLVARYTDIYSALLNKKDLTCTSHA